MSRNSTPVPFIVSPSWIFDGDIGAWASFKLEVGTPPQSFRVWPSTASSETWVPHPELCQELNVTNCGSLRGVDDFNGQPSQGFQSSASSTWDLIGIYVLGSERNLFGLQDEGFYGRDTVKLEPLIGSPLNLTSQTVAGTATIDFWLGVLGLGIAVGNFTTQAENIKSPMDTLKSSGEIPSLSFGYSAGAAYKKDYGSLILGGYDQALFGADNLSFPLTGANNMGLSVNVKSIVTEDRTQAMALLQNGDIVATIDSTVHDLWLPKSVCDVMVETFGLIYDDSTSLYILNSTAHSKNLENSPTVTFTIGANDSTAATKNIVLPYAAFDLNASVPTYNSSTPVFPLRTAANDSQYVLGRAFLQEAYLIVDWERQNFTVSQAIHQNKTTNIITIPPRTDDVSVTITKSSSAEGLSAGAIAGIAVGVGVLILIASAIAIVFLRRRRRRAAAASQEYLEAPARDTKNAEVLDGGHVNELQGSGNLPSEIMSHQIHELHHNDRAGELMSHPVSELAGQMAAGELSNEARRDAEKDEGKGVRSTACELP